MINARRNTKVAPSGFQAACCHSAVSLAPDCKLEFEAYAASVAPLEACGVVCDSKFWPCRNIADDPERDFVIDPRSFAAAALSGAVTAVIHSHPMGGPASAADLSACRGTGLPWHIYSMPDKKWSSINP